jgi:UDP-glucuronate 4-epimerase
MNILLTGSAGFIGSYVSRCLLDRGDTVVGLDNINSYYDINLKYGRLRTLGVNREAIDWYKFVQSDTFANFRFIRMNLEDRQAMKMLFANGHFDVVVNLGAQAGVRYSIENPYAYVESNVDGFLNILEGCRHSGIFSLAAPKSHKHKHKSALHETRSTAHSLESDLHILFKTYIQICLHIHYIHEPH